ncbi:MAG: hypothetical protein GY862_38810 [Gammaproteobacteria bacterium]|nr:hypothetical protein [Gammaproteobacteria bacterium]
MRKDWNLIRRRFGLLDDAPLETLLERVEQARNEAAGDVEPAYLYAELLRALGREQEARQAYRQVERLSVAHSGERHDGLGDRLHAQQRHLRLGLALYAGVFALLLGIGLWFLLFDTPDQQTETPAQDLSLVRWLAQQQALELARLIREKYPHLPSEQVLQSATQNPWSAVQACMGAGSPAGGAGGQANRGEQSPANPKNETTPQNPVLPATVRCSYPIQCRPVNLQPRSSRLDGQLYGLLKNIRISTLHKKDCETYARVSERFEKRFGWHKSGQARSYNEEKLSYCFYENKNYERAIVYVENQICAGFKPLVLLGYNALSFSLLQSDNLPDAVLVQQCTISYADYLTQITSGFNVNNIALGYGNIANFALYAQGPESSLPFYRQGLALLNKLPTERVYLQDKMGIQLSLLAAQVAARSPVTNIEQTRIASFANPTASDSHKFMLDGLSVISQLQRKDYPTAIIANRRVTDRLRQTNRYNCQFAKGDIIWEWDKYLATLLKFSHPEEQALHPQYQQIIEAMDCEERSKEERLAKLRSVGDWLEKQILLGHN